MYLSIIISRYTFYVNCKKEEERLCPAVSLWEEKSLERCERPLEKKRGGVPG